MYSPHETNQNAYNALRSISLLQRAQMDNKYNNEIQSLIQHGLSQEHKNEEISRQNNFIPFRKPPYYSPNIPFRESRKAYEFEEMMHCDRKSPYIPFRESRNHNYIPFRESHNHYCIPFRESRNHNYIPFREPRKLETKAYYSHDSDYYPRKKHYSHKSETDEGIVDRTKPYYSHDSDYYPRKKHYSHKSETDEGIVDRTKPYYSHDSDYYPRKKHYSHKSETDEGIVDRTKPCYSHDSDSYPRKTHYPRKAETDEGIVDPTKPCYSHDSDSDPRKTHSYSDSHHVYGSIRPKTKSKRYHREWQETNMPKRTKKTRLETPSQGKPENESHIMGDLLKNRREIEYQSLSKADKSQLIWLKPMYQLDVMLVRHCNTYFIWLKTPDTLIPINVMHWDPCNIQCDLLQSHLLNPIIKWDILLQSQLFETHSMVLNALWTAFDHLRLPQITKRHVSFDPVTKIATPQTTEHYPSSISTTPPTHVHYPSSISSTPSLDAIIKHTTPCLSNSSRSSSQKSRSSNNTSISSKSTKNTSISSKSSNNTSISSKSSSNKSKMQKMIENGSKQHKQIQNQHQAMNDIITNQQHAQMTLSKKMLDPETSFSYTDDFSSDSSDPDDLPSTKDDDYKPPSPINPNLFGLNTHETRTKHIPTLSQSTSNKSNKIAIKKNKNKKKKKKKNKNKNKKTHPIDIRRKILKIFKQIKTIFVDRPMAKDTHVLARDYRISWWGSKDPKLMKHIKSAIKASGHKYYELSFLGPGTYIGKDTLVLLDPRLTDDRVSRSNFAEDTLRKFFNFWSTCKMIQISDFLHLVESYKGTALTLRGAAKRNVPKGVVWWWPIKLEKQMREAFVRQTTSMVSTNTTSNESLVSTMAMTTPTPPPPPPPGRSLSTPFRSTIEEDDRDSMTIFDDATQQWKQHIVTEYRNYDKQSIPSLDRYAKSRFYFALSSKDRDNLSTEQLHLLTKGIKEEVLQDNKIETGDLCRMHHTVTQEPLTYWLTTELLEHQMQSIEQDVPHICIIDMITANMILHLQNHKNSKGITRIVQRIQKNHPNWSEFVCFFAILNNGLNEKGNHWLTISTDFVQRRASGRLRRATTNKYSCHTHYFDSLNNKPNPIVSKAIKVWYKVIQELLQISAMTNRKLVKISPIQDNCYDCGLYPSRIILQLEERAEDAAGTLPAALKRMDIPAQELVDARIVLTNNICDLMEAIFIQHMADSATDENAKSRDETTTNNTPNDTNKTDATETIEPTSESDDANKTDATETIEQTCSQPIKRIQLKLVSPVRSDQAQEPVDQNASSLVSPIRSDQVQEPVDQNASSLVSPIRSDQAQEPVDQNASSLVSPIRSDQVQEPVDQNASSLVSPIRSDQVQAPVDQNASSLVSPIRSDQAQEPVDQNASSLVSPVRSDQVQEPVDRNVEMNEDSQSKKNNPNAKDEAMSQMNVDSTSHGSDTTEPMDVDDSDEKNELMDVDTTNNRSLIRICTRTSFRCIACNRSPPT
eukprot:51250_1